MGDSPITHHTALVYVMVLVSAADSEMADQELESIGQSVRDLPVFRDYDRGNLLSAAQGCAEILSEADGLQTVLSLVRDSLPKELYDTAYAIACDIAVTDGHLSQEELRLLEMIRHELSVDRLTAAAIERGVAALNRTVSED